MRYIDLINFLAKESFADDMEVHLEKEKRQKTTNKDNDFYIKIYKNKKHIIYIGEQI